MSVEREIIKDKIVKIVPPALPPAREGATQCAVTMGTKVYAEDGAEIHGVTRIELIGDLNDVWRAKIECLVAPPEITCLADIEYRRFDLESIAAAIYAADTMSPPPRAWKLRAMEGETLSAVYLNMAQAACDAIRKAAGLAK